MEKRPWIRHYDYNVPATLRYPRIGVHELLTLPANSLPNKPALAFHGTEITFFELRQIVRRFANALGELGIEKGERVGLQLPTSPQYVIAYYALLSLGAIVINVSPMSTERELEHMTASTGMTTLFSTDDKEETVGALAERAELRRVIITRTSDFATGTGPTVALDLPPSWHHFSTLLDSTISTRRQRVEIAPEDPAQIQFTGGTTGLPKGATLTHGNVVTATLLCSQWGNAITTLQSVATRNVLSVLPYCHVYGNVVAMNTAIFNGSTQILVDRFEVDGLIDLISGLDEISFFPAVPTLISAVIRHPRAGDLRLDRKLGLLNSGGAPMPLELIERIDDLGINYGEGWGMSESTSLGISNPLLGLSKAGSIGVPLPDVDVRLVDVETGVEEVPVGEAGELILKGPLVMSGYWNDPGETADQIREGWLHTGDVAVRDEDDYFHIVDRKKDMIIAGGLNIYPREIDEVLFQHPKVLEAVAVGLPDEYRGETVKAFVVLRENETATADEIIAFCRGILASYKVPQQVEFRDRLPKSGVGKVLRKILRQEDSYRRGGPAEG